MNTADAKRLKELEKENSRLKKLVADLSLDNAILMINRWVTYYNEIRPHSSLGGRPPAPQTIIPITA